MPKLLKNYPKRGEIFVADLNPAFGREIHKKRPVLIISSDVLNEHSSLVIILPLSSIIPQNIGFEMVKITGSKELPKESVILLDQIRSIDKIRLVKRIAKSPKKKMLELEEALNLVLGMNKI